MMTQVTLPSSTGIVWLDREAAAIGFYGPAFTIVTCDTPIPPLRNPPSQYIR